MIKATPRPFTPLALQAAPYEPMPTFSVHLHCTACGGRGVFDGKPCWCQTEQTKESREDAGIK